MRDFAAEGIAVFEGVFAPDEMAALATLLPEEVAGQRGLLRKIPAVRALAGDIRLRNLLVALGSAASQPVRAVFFDKNPARNWKVPWHQDLTIAVRQRHAVPGFGPWSIKDGVPHVQPPAALLDRMVTLRVHLDDCAPENGALRVRPRSHRHGRIAESEMPRWDFAPETTCVVRAGGVVALRPLLLHASSPAQLPRHRRVVHIEYSPDTLPEPLEWFDSEAAGLEIHR